MKNLLLLTIVCLSMSACGTNDSETVRTLNNAGYTDVVPGGYAFFQCDSKDKFQTKFTATNPVGNRVAGVVCCGWLKSCTIRH